MIGKTLGRYRIIEQVGRGGMAEVYKAYHSGLDRYVAIKLMHVFLADEAGFIDRFKREAQSVARLRHPNIVQMLDFDAEDDVSYMVMEFLEGPSLKNKLTELESEGKWLTLEEAIRIVHDVGDALDYAHRQGMVHRDVKPANIMLTADGGAILTDFGIVKMLSAATQLTASGAMVGTPAYMAPEQSMGVTDDDRADIYSLGIVLYQLVTGRLPYDADTPMAIVLKHLNAPLPIPSTLNPDLPEGIERVILKSLAKDPEDRYQSVQEMLDHLSQAAKGGIVPKVDPAITMANQPLFGPTTLAGDRLATPVPATQTPTRRPPWWAIGLAGLALAAILAGGFTLLSDGKAMPTPEPTKVAVATITSSPRPTNTPDMEATSRAATLDAALLTINAPTATPTPTFTPTPTPTPTNTPTTTPTPDATAIALAACSFDATLDLHVNVQPGTFFGPEWPIVKTWRITNNGDCIWLPDTEIAFVSGDQMDAKDSVKVGAVSPGDTAEITVEMHAPETNGNYTGVWQLQMADGTPFGEKFLVEINVGPTPTPPPTNTPRPTNTPLPTPTSIGPLGMSIPTLLGGSCWIDHPLGTWGGTLVWSAWGGTGTYEYYLGEIRQEFRLEGPSYDFVTQTGRPWPGGTFFTVSGAEVFSLSRGVDPSECGYK